MASTLAPAALLIALSISSEALGRQAVAPDRMPRLGEIDARFQSYNIEMVEVTGGRFWKPYESHGKAPAERDRYAERPPIDLSNARLRKLALTLAPAYLRVSGSWANATYFAGPDDSAGTPPPGYDSVLTRAQWRGVINFARTVDARIVTSFAVSPGARDATGRWTPDQARQLLAYTHTLAGHIAAAGFMNEPNLVAQNGTPAGYNASAYARDFRVFRDLIRETSPQTLITGPDSVGEISGEPPSMRVRDLLAAIGGDIDAVSYHHYGTVSPRCGGRDRPDQVLSEQWLSRTDQTLSFYKALRDAFAPGKPIWLTETGDAACGGNSWDATFLDSFRYLDQLGRLARSGVQVVMHNTLAGSDYGLLDETTFAPRPNYWAALLWHRLMGKTVLDAGVPQQGGLHVYAHCHPANTGGVTLLAINSLPDTSNALIVPGPSARYTLRAASLQSKSVQLNGRTLSLGPGDALPDLDAAPTQPGLVILPPASISFLVIPAAHNAACH